MTSVEAHRELVVDGDVTQALDMCRRLLRTESSLQRVETAHLVLERLRSGADDSSDGVNALLRLLGNYVAPTRELTEEILSLLLFCDHRVLLIHHLPKLTYQSKECVQLVVQAYLELLATDRLLLVPVLGSLAEMPLDNSEKNTIVEATQSLLDAAVEEDIPAVVQSLLSMATKSSAPKALARLRTECNRIQSGTLSLTMEVVGRFATSGSVALTALLRLIRHAEPLTTFDIVLLTFVMGKSAENEAEMCGFNLPVKTNLLVLRGGTFATRTAKSIITKCIAWRVEQSVTDNTGALGHLSVLFGAADAMATTMETVTSAFQERVMLKMQYNGNSRRKGGWANELLAKAYGKKYNTRRWISKSEAKLLPFFSHGIQELQDFLQDQSSVNNIALEAAKADWESADSVWSDYEHRDVMLSDDKLVSACRTLQAKELTATLFKDWRPALSIDNDDDETDLEDDEELDELDKESLSEEEDDGADGFVVKSYATATSNRKPVPGLTGRKQLAVELQDNEDLGFPTIVVNFKKQKKTHKSS
ncbi:hypothetical protein JG688_00004091 [Phytophthora aleatoria]|uniref:Uncharacterized protein n=1 Tax=Phytophthora aleatoria TaxID=2496075 RepID=A0A8J5M9L6_9STRA|nr:hypothetical protein JG688_00004091 [Phytophthora aleatoria]